MKLIELLKDVEYKLIQGSLDVDVSDITYNSKNANECCAFIALKGFRVDGHKFVSDAVDNGCKVIIVEDDVVVDRDITVIKISDTRTNLSKIS